MLTAKIYSYVKKRQFCTVILLNSLEDSSINAWNPLRQKSMVKLFDKTLDLLGKLLSLDIFLGNFSNFSIAVFSENVNRAPWERLSHFFAGSPF